MNEAVHLYTKGGDLVGVFSLKTGRAQIGDSFYAPERACRNNAPSYLRFLCSECGYVIYHDDVNETGDREEDTPNLCPNCGARVKED